MGSTTGVRSGEKDLRIGVRRTAADGRRQGRSEEQRKKAHRKEPCQAMASYIVVFAVLLIQRFGINARVNR